MKKVGSFIYKYQENGTVAVANLTWISRLLGQMIVHEHMDRIAKSTGYFCDLAYGGNLYTAIVFANVPEKELVEALSN